MSERQIRRLSQVNAETDRVQPAELRRLGLGTDAPLQPHPDTSAYPSGTSNAAAKGGVHHDAAFDVGHGAYDEGPVSKNPFRFDR